ncbi:TetR/AcrR family transcriptional regulator [Actinomadura sp. DC4]|uniref:TetR/AcrR family transcriptional regulator n=1 Tax=Actinomadura sp. DC4 TaxID=3055069 RepID=UPI0025B052EA|nr:TetR/AcrR family transcriptional regulator [Actinomadura sp. DC4]MDN3354415.1 TetR/AcrR family transcriptional regulator [Actinomadura sp. DC4]
MAPTDGRADHRTGPRRRGEVLEAAILDATLAELNDVGYARLAMERIAARAHTSKASLYKRWPSRAELVVAALRHGRGPADPAPDTGSLREDVLTLLRRGARRLEGPFGEAARGLMVETLTDPDRTARVRAGMFVARDRLMREILDRAAARGDIAATAIKPRLIGLAPALVDHHFLIHGTPIPDGVLTGIVDDVLLPLLVPDARD